MASINPHNRTRPDDDDEDDPVEKMLKKTGCLELHYAVQECIADTKDWRKCQNQVADFRKCIEASKEKANPKKKMEVSDKEPFVDKVLSWCWKIIKRRLGPDAALFEEGDMYLKLSSKYIPLEIQKDLQTNSVQVFPCGIANCTQVFNSVSKYETHYNSCHRNVCQTCHRILPSAHLLEIHILETHDVMFALQAEKQDMYQCLLENCSQKFKDTAARRNHMVKIHKYPSNYRYDRHKQKSKPKKKGVSHRNGDAVAMETDPVPEPRPIGSETDRLNTRPEEKVSSGRIFSHKVPKNICFGQGVSRGFLGGRGRGRGKHSNKKHWYNKDQTNMDTAVDIETVDMSELSTALS